MPVEQPIDPARRQAAERRVLDAMRRFHRAEPLARDIRVDALVRRVRAAADADRRPRSHRGGASFDLTDPELQAVIGGLVAAGRLERRGHRVNLPGDRPGLGAEMQSRVDRLIEGLRAAGAEPPRVEAVASRIGIPPAVIDQVRASGMLVSLGPGIDYPREVLEALLERIAGLSTRGPLTTGRVAVALGTSRRYADALLDRHRARRSAEKARRRRPR
jgi:Elongation factor SelB, winged helix